MSAARWQLLCVGLFLAAVTPAVSGDIVWRIWCGDPETPRQGVYDNSRECWDMANSTEAEDGCEDTKAGPRFMGARLPAWDREGFHNCAEVRRRNSHCHCKPEIVQ